jgi:hypothetical protein
MNRGLSLRSAFERLKSSDRHRSDTDWTWFIASSTNPAAGEYGAPGRRRNSAIPLKRLRKAIPLVGNNHHAEATFHTLAKAMERRLAALEHRRLHPFDQEEPPGG